MTRWLETRRIFVGVIALGLFAMAARNVTDPDVWWHLKAGQYIIEHRTVPHADPFSYTRAGQPWVAHEWLSEVLLYELYRAAGWGGLIVVFAAVTCAAFMILFLRCVPDPYVTGIATLWGAWATLPLWGVRPQILSLLLTSLWLLILERSQRNRRLLWWTLPLTLLWVNLHAGFALGLVLSALFLAGEYLERSINPASSPTSNPRLRLLGLTLLFDVLLVPLNPNGLRMYSYPIETLRSPAMQAFIAEWASPNFHRAEYRPFLFLILATAMAIAWSHRRIRVRDLLPLLVAVFAALSSIRMIPLFVLLAVPPVSHGLQHWAKTEKRNQYSSSGFTRLANLLILLAIVALASAHAAHVARHQAQAEAEFFPTRAVAFLAAHPASGPMFNHYDWGGYLIWKLYPASRVFIDGRADLYGEQLLNDFANAYDFKDGWQRTLDQWKVETVLIPSNSALATGLRISPGWAVLYEDKQAILLRRHFEESPPMGSANAPPRSQPMAQTVPE